MRRSNWLGAVAALMLLAVGCQGRSSGAAAPGDSPQGSAAAPKSVREAALAGIFYPADPQELAATADRLLAEAKTQPISRLRGLVCPHAGYEYSGPIAAVGYKQLDGRTIHTAIVMAPSHYVAFEGASIPDVDAFRTPLGLILLSPKAAELRKNKLFDPHPPCQVQRPEWSRMSPLEPPPAGEDTPHTWEHALEVQLPFLQRMLKQFQLVPIVFGRCDPKAVANALAGCLDQETLVIASSDLSHYHPYAEANDLDNACIDAICTLNTSRLETQEACGKEPILTLVHLAKQKGWQAKLLDHRNSGDVKGDRSAVVGYTAIAFYEAEGNTSAKPPASSSFSTDERKFMLELARKTIVAAVQEKPAPEPDEADVPQPLRSPRACFVTLTEHDQLRGCIGHILPQAPLFKAIVECATSAALRDPRFDPVKADELEKIRIEVSILTVPEPLEFRSPEDLLAKLRPNVDGVVLSIGRRAATFLPQVWEQLPDKVEFLNHLSQKAGLPAAAWREAGTKVQIYQVEAFQEERSRKK